VSDQPAQTTVSDRPVERPHELVLRLVSKPAWFLACALAIPTLAMQFYKNARLQVRMEQAQEDEQRLKEDVAALEVQASRRNGRVQAIAKEVNVELEKRHELTLAMADVLARARGLQQQHDRFEELQKEIQRHLDQMENYYATTQRQTGAARP
jgi:chromosome segregation ATPase